MYFLLHQGFFLEENMTVVPHPPYSPVSPIEDESARTPL
jgi:hypothetical protein